MDWVRWSNLIKINFTFNWILNSYSSNIQISISWFYLFEHRTNQKPISPHKLRVNIVCLWVLRISTKKIKLVRQINLLDLFFFCWLGMSWRIINSKFCPSKEAHIGKPAIQLHLEKCRRFFSKTSVVVLIAWIVSRCFTQLFNWSNLSLLELSCF